MQRDSILHCLTPAANLSPFDVNMAIDAGWQHCIPYTGLGIGEVPALTQDAIFSRGPKGVWRTGLFIGGRDVHLAVDMLEAARRSMVPPFEISVFADPSGAFTTAAGMVACAEKHLREGYDTPLDGRRVLVFGGTGPVGSICGVLAAQAGGEVTLVSHESRAKAEQAAALCAQRYGVVLQGADGSGDTAVRDLLATAELVFCAAPAGVQVLRAEQLRAATDLKVACDVNAVPPAGIEGVGAFDDGKIMTGVGAEARGIGALAVGNVKYRTQRELLERMLAGDQPSYLHFEQAFAAARQHV